MFLSRFEFAIEHIEGELNVSNILTRWVKGYISNTMETRNICSLVHLSDQLTPQLDETSFSSMDTIMTAQRKFDHENPNEAEVDPDRLLKVNGKTWVPSDNELKLKILVGSHCGVNGHRGSEATFSIIMESYT